MDNASTDGIREWLISQNDIKLICNETNIGFPAGCNAGIKIAAPDNDILLLNNDTLLTPNAIFWLRMGLYESERTGAAGFQCRLCHNSFIIHYGSGNGLNYNDIICDNIENKRLDYAYENLTIRKAVS